MDARFPTHWLNDRRILRLSPEQFRMFVIANAWSVTNGTDGIIETQDLPLVPFASEAQAAALVGAGLWSVIPSGWYILSFEDAQTSSAQLEGLRQKKRQDADRSKAYRDRKKASRDSSRDGMRDDHVTNGMTTKARKGKAKASLDIRDNQGAVVPTTWAVAPGMSTAESPMGNKAVEPPSSKESVSLPSHAASDEAERIAREAAEQEKIAAIAWGTGESSPEEPAPWD